MGYITCFKALGTCYLTCYVALTREVMGAKHDKVKKNKAKFRLRYKIVTIYKPSSNSRERGMLLSTFRAP